MALTCHQRVAKAEEALKAIELCITTDAGRRRLSQVWSGMRALDEEQCAIRCQIANLIDSLDTGYSAPEVIEDLREIVRGWDAAEKTKRAAKRKTKASVST